MEPGDRWQEAARARHPQGEAGAEDGPDEDGPDEDKGRGRQESCRIEAKAQMKAKPPKAQLESFIAKFTPDVAAAARQALARIRTLVPGAVEMAYDNYNALAIGFGPTERASEAVMSIAVFPKWVTLCFLQNGPKLHDPKRLLRGSGNVVRHVRLQSPADLDTPDIRALIQDALSRARVRIDPAGRRRLIIKSVSAKQRPRRPSTPA
jgi:hypothetical protein